MSKINILSSYIFFININNTNMMKICSAFDNRNIINTLFKNNMIVSS